MSGAGDRVAAADSAARLAIVGAGRAGRAIAAGIVHGATDVRLVALIGRTPHPAADRVPAVTVDRSALRTASIVLVTVRDAQLDDALRALHDDGALADGAIVLHASGATDPASLGALRARGHACGTFHPLVPLLGAATAERLRGAWIGIDGDARAIDAARALARAVGAHALDIPAGAKPRYHAAAVLASNFPVVLAALAARLLRDAGVEPPAADGAVRALLAGAVRNIDALDALSAERLAAALSGPAARGDADTVALHLGALAGDASARGAYAALTAAAVDTLRAGGREVPRLDAVLRTIDEPRG